MSKRKIKTFHQLVEEYKNEIAKNPKEMDVIYDKIDRRHENRLLAISKAKQT
ncbi:Fur-regulated basic protein FbpB [Bacillus paralicheniformis]|uniref:Fur-regulated basic protein FbpB n=1 Tax=Bacillus paralicheniformis TaxID=1648923 RepID=UPI0013EEEFB1|nr:Fur-regulated basic protein FbpB [Bacillus paralicheniformis]QII47714.1 Fur-regulated basic protein FbpB [Bacillus paralicheniformis]